MSTVIFVYALDGGIFNEVSSFVHKLLSPRTYACNLCMLSNGLFAPKREWAEFIRNLGVKTEFRHRDEYARQYPTSPEISFPAIFRASDAANPELLVSSEDLRGCRNLTALMSLVNQRLKVPQDSKHDI